MHHVGGKPLLVCSTLAFIIALCTCQSATSLPACGSLGVTTTISGPLGATDIYTFNGNGVELCSTYSGSIALATAPALDTLDMNTVEILGDFIVENHRTLQTLAGGLTTVRGDFIMRNNPLLSHINLSSLGIAGSMSLTSMQNLTKASFSTSELDITNLTVFNTGLQTLNIYASEMANAIIGNNHMLGTINFPILETAELIRISNQATIGLKILLPLLQNVTDSLEVYRAAIPTFPLPQFTMIKGDLFLGDISLLQTLTWGKLASVGSFEIDGADLLETLELPQLGNASEFNVIGNISRVDLSALKYVSKYFNITSLNPEFDCSTFDSKTSIFNGSYTCQNTTRKAIVALNHTVTDDPNSTFTNDPPGPAASHSPKENKLLGVKIGVPVAVFSIITGIIFFLYRRIQAKKQIMQSDYAEKEVVANTSPKLLGELDDQAISRKELATGAEAHELMDQHGVTKVGENDIGIHESHEMPA